MPGIVDAAIRPRIRVAVALAVVLAGCEPSASPLAPAAVLTPGTWTQDFQAFFYFPHAVPAQMSGQVNGASLQFAIAAASGATVISIGPRSAVRGAGSSFGACGV